MTRDYLDEVEAQLMARVEHGGRKRPPRRRRELLAIVPAVAAAAVIVAVVLTVAGGGRRPGHVPALGVVSRSATVTVAAPAHGSPTATLPTTSTTTPAATLPTTSTTTPAATLPTTSTTTPVASAPSGPVPPGFSPESFTAIGELTWWLLGTAPCASPPCTSIVRTDDGGQTFAGTPAPRTAQVSQLRFADSQNGFAYGPQLWVTHDAGATWSQIGVGGQVTELEAGGGYAYAIVRNSTGTGRLLRAPVGSDDWSQLPISGDPTFGLSVRGSDVVLETSGASAQHMLVSSDGGATFTTRSVPPSVECSFAEMLPVIWAECPTGTLSGVWRSTDGGTTFAALSSRGGPGAPANGLPEEPNSAAFAAATATTALYGYQQLYRTTDGGASWSQVPTPPAITWWQYLGFTDATHGVALGYAGSESAANERLYYTTDGGASYRVVTVSSG